MDPATTEIYTLSLHDALPISLIMLGGINTKDTMDRAMAEGFDFVAMGRALLREPDLINRMQAGERSEEHTSELQSRRDLVCRLLLEKKKRPGRRVLPPGVCPS